MSRPAPPLPLELRLKPADHPRDLIFLQVEAERQRQEKLWGEQNHRDGTGYKYEGRRKSARLECENSFAWDVGTWADILLEEVYEALAETNLGRLREELLQTAAVACAWVEAIDRRPR